MSKKYILQTQPLPIPVPDNKLILEHFGGATTGHQQFSLARMVAPPGWSEPHQTPEFDEVTLMLRGRKRIEIDGEQIELSAGQSILIKAGARIRYSNPYAEENEYISLCMPAFSPNLVHREAE
ncbi:cupin domain-containing protein [Cesiribacter andamanensis]|uniref:Cupin domain protein n=1 Tax=Cesiribacter andamanensis AMV16 TaxID=1279009 RepID=M7NRN9_9BACT|nr:cupin domain-containing protein [Cesiribacter andamanensis]EMR04355.1 Cupin domain protein [Cesiribacter andamanensis AMV16]